MIPKELREQAGLAPGPVEIVADGAGIRIEGIADDVLVEEEGLLVIPASGTAVDDELVRRLRDAGRR